MTARPLVSKRTVYRRVLDPSQPVQGDAHVAGMQGELAGFLGQRWDESWTYGHTMTRPSRFLRSGDSGSR